MDIKELEEANEAIAMLEQLDLPISMDQLGKRKILEKEYLNENVIPRVQSYIQSLVEQLHKSFCLVVEYQYGEPVQVRIAEQTKLKSDTIQRLKKNEARVRLVNNAFKSDRVEQELDRFLKSLPKKNPYVKFAVTQSYSSLSKLLRTLQSKDLLQYISPLFKALNLPTTGTLGPTAFVKLLEPEQFVKQETRNGTIDRIVLWSQSQKVEKQWDGARIKKYETDGVTPIMVDKTKEIKEGQWSLKTLCKIMAQKEYFANLHSKKKHE